MAVEDCCSSSFKFLASSFKVFVSSFKVFEMARKRREENLPQKGEIFSFPLRLREVIEGLEKYFPSE